MNKFEGLRKKFEEKEKLVMLTAYDVVMGRILDEAGIDLVLVGDSMAMVVLGDKNTKEISLDEMINHTRAVSRGVEKAIVIGDMPIGTYDEPEQALENTRKFLDAGADAIKIEGNKREVLKKLIENGIQVQAHLGLLPQTAKEMKVQGRTEEQAKEILRDAKEVAEQGCFSLVLEGVPQKLAKRITKEIDIPTIGIGAGIHCSGQVLVINDLLGLFDDFKQKFVKRYADVRKTIFDAVVEFKKDVKNGKFPDETHS